MEGRGYGRAVARGLYFLFFLFFSGIFVHTQNPGASKISKDDASRSHERRVHSFCFIVFELGTSDLGQTALKSFNRVCI